MSCGWGKVKGYHDVSNFRIKKLASVFDLKYSNINV